MPLSRAMSCRSILFLPCKVSSIVSPEAGHPKPVSSRPASCCTRWTPVRRWACAIARCSGCWLTRALRFRGKDRAKSPRNDLEAWLNGYMAAAGEPSKWRALESKSPCARFAEAVRSLKSEGGLSFPCRTAPVLLPPVGRTLREQPIPGPQRRGAR